MDDDLEGDMREQRLQAAMEWVKKRFQENQENPVSAKQPRHPLPPLSFAQPVQSVFKRRTSTPRGIVKKKFRPAGHAASKQGARPSSVSGSARVTRARTLSQVIQQSSTTAASPSVPPSASRAASPESLPLPPACREHEIEEFLQNCKPNMVHHLDAFLAFGCNNNDYLSGMAKWDKELILEVLKRLISEGTRLATRNNSAEGASQMELVVILHHLNETFGGGVSE